METGQKNTKIFDIEMIFVKTIEAETEEEAKREMANWVSLLGVNDIIGLTVAREIK